jgi:hypothetical protein
MEMKMCSANGIICFQILDLYINLCMLNKFIRNNKWSNGRNIEVCLINSCGGRRCPVFYQYVYLHTNDLVIEKKKRKQ